MCLHLRHVLENPLAKEKDRKENDDSGDGDNLPFEDCAAKVGIAANFDSEVSLLVRQREMLFQT
jgi:hypothetical protein